MSWCGFYMQLSIFYQTMQNIKNSFGIPITTDEAN